MASNSLTNESQKLGSKNTNWFNEPPDWNLAPNWANWLAQDSFRTWWWYELKPTQALVAGIWMKQNDNLAYAGVSPLNRSWRDTLIERPEE